jgi:GTPase SAR1 family protein
MNSKIKKDFDYQIKIITIGDAKVGKTSITYNCFGEKPASLETIGKINL